MPASKRKQKITPRALLELKMPGDVQIASDGRRIAYAVQETNFDDNRTSQHLWVTTTEDDATPRQVTRGTGDESAPRWSPDGNWLAFFAARDEDEGNLGDEADDDYDEPKQQVYLLPMDGGGGEAEKLTDAPEGVGAYDWLPDSSGIVYLAREPRPKPLQTNRDDKLDRKDDAVAEREEKWRQQLWRIGIEDKKAKLVHAGDFGLGELAVAPDGKSVAFTTNYTGEVNDYHKADVWTLSLEDGKTRQLTDGPGGKYHPVWTPDSEAILFTRTLDPNLSYSQENLFSVPAIGGESVNLTADFPHDLVGWHGAWFDAAGNLYVSAAVGTTTGIFRRVGGDGPFESILQADEHIHEFHVAPDGGLAFVVSSTVDVPEVCWLAPGASDAIAVSDLNEDWYEKHVLAPVELVSFPSRDGLTIEATLTLPVGYDEEQMYPLILSLHGGPHARTLQALTTSTTAQLYAAEGYAVLSPNYRGSEGYGDAFGRASQNDLGGGDYADCLAAVQWAIDEGIADPARLGVVGSSYGAYLVNWIVGHTNQFKAAVSKFGIFSLATDFSNSEAPRWEMEYLGGAPWERPEMYAERSPAAFVQNVQTPVLIMHGEGDPNTFVANSQEMYQALFLQNKTVEYVHFPREGHGFYEPNHRLDETRRCLAWFDKHLRPADLPAIHRPGDTLMVNGWEMTVTKAAVTTYAGQRETERRFVEVVFAVRDAAESGEPFSLSPGDVSLTRGLSSTGRSGRPVGLPIDVLGVKVLAEGTGWRFVFAPAKDERGLAVAVALTFRISNVGGTYALAVKDFPPVTLDFPAADDKDDKGDSP